jgi:hypothetical protein
VLIFDALLVKMIVDILSARLQSHFFGIFKELFALTP